jgi:hypothetical protein
LRGGVIFGHSLWKGDLELRVGGNTDSRISDLEI